MRGMTIVAGIAPASIVGASEPGGEFLATADPKEVWRAAGQQGSIDVDFGREVEIDRVFLGFSNAAAGSQIQLQSTLDPAGAGLADLTAPAFFPAAQEGRRSHLVIGLGAVAAVRWLRIYYTQGPGGPPLELGIFLAGLRFEAAYEYKSGRRPIDLSERVDLAGGGFGFGRGAIKAGFRFTFADLADAEAEELWDLVKEVGNQHPVLLVEGGDEPVLQSQIHYCIFDRFEAFERSDAADTRWLLSITDWI